MKINKKIERYLGTEIPQNIDIIRDELYLEVYERRWIKELDEVQVTYFNEIRDLPRSVLNKKLQEFSIRFTYNSNRIEGSTLKLRDTQLLLEDNISPGNRPMKDVLETKSHHQVFIQMLEYDGELDQDVVLSWHRNLLIDTDPEIAGSFRHYNVGIAFSRAITPHFHDLPVLLDELFQWIKSNMETLILHPVVLAALIHQKFVSIHPFADGNGRISRLLQNFILNKYNMPMMIIDYSDRRSYYNALERSNLRDDPHLFVLWFIRTYLKTKKNMVRAIKALN